MISDQDALLVAGEILAGFLKENLPVEDRWDKYVLPNFRGQINIHERSLDQLDLSSLLQVFMGNKDHFHQVGVFRTGLPFQLALCVRGMRNSRAHQAYAASVTEDERLFDLHSLRRFTMLIDNRAVKPGLAEQFHAALDTRILEATRRCLGDDRDEASEDANANGDPELSALFELSIQTHEDLASVQNQLREVAARLADVAAATGASLTSAELESPTEARLGDRMGAIEWKLDQLLAQRAPLATAVEAAGAPEEAEQSGLPEKLSYLEAKAALRTLRARLADRYPDTEPVRQLLRQSMVDLFLERRIADQSSYDNQVPEVMRRDTEKTQLRALPQVFDVVARLR